MAGATSTGAEEQQKYMRYALSLAKQAPPKSTNFCVGAVLVEEVTNQILATGYTMELPGNTHAEQCCLTKYQKSTAATENRSGRVVLYTTMEPCNKRASGNVPCTETILRSQHSGNHKIETVYVGVQEPEKFVGQNSGRTKLEEGGIEYIHISGFEDEILAVATRGHEKSPQS